MVKNKEVVTICKDCKTRTIRIMPDWVEYCINCETVAECNTEEILV